MKMKDPNFDPNEVVRKYQETGEQNHEDVVNSVMATVRIILSDAINNSAEGLGIATDMLTQHMPTRERMESGLWQDMLDHLTMFRNLTVMNHFLGDRLAADQVWLRDSDTGFNLFLAGQPVWDSEQAETLPEGTVVRFLGEYGYRVLTKGPKGGWYLGTIPTEPIFPMVVLAGPAEEDEYEQFTEAAEGRRRALGKD